ncbi:hypothetical protein E1B28_006592 [Marasmius oreades]|uniref:Uncharacterized protein n=1 Tax=Marasmius oreades TaxID=181124 RepID=A0A9P7UWG0_9AGAR|nr:uncharacterized protein E1B28_006592 [Marasmius oreades]KAG7095905.1 hypothetical protein E1B28_006592 [Marasmius oreades]
MPMQTDVAELAGIVVEAVLYGIFTVLTIGTLYVLLRGKRGRSALNHPLIFTSVLMFVLATVQIVVDCVVIFDAFIEINPRPVRKLKMSNIRIPIVAAKRALFFAMMILGDAIVIYRCWMVWGKNWLVIILSSFCCIASGTLAYMTIYATQHAGSLTDILKHPWVYGTAIFTLSIIANGIATSLIAFRIWRNERKLVLPSVSTKSTSGLSVISGRGSLLPIARILVESGALNTAYLIAYTIVLQVEEGQGSLPIVADMSTPLVGIIFSLVIVRVQIRSTQIMRPSTDGSTTAASRTGLSFAFNQNRSEQLSDQDMYALEESNASLEGKTIAYTKQVHIHADFELRPNGS